MNQPVKNASITEPLSAHAVANHVGAQHLGSIGSMSALVTGRHCRDGPGICTLGLGNRFLVSSTWSFGLGLGLGLDLGLGLGLGLGGFGDKIGIRLGCGVIFT